MEMGRVRTIYGFARMIMRVVIMERGGKE